MVIICFYISFYSKFLEQIKYSVKSGIFVIVKYFLDLYVFLAGRIVRVHD